MIAAEAQAQPAPTAQVQDATEDRNRSLIARSFEAWRTRSGSPYDLLVDDASWTITGNSAAAKTYPTREAFMREVIRPFNARMREPLSPTIRRLYAEGDTVIALFDAQGTARDGKPYSNSYAWFLEMRDGRIVRARAFFDSIAFDDLWRRVPPAPADAGGRRRARVDPMSRSARPSVRRADDGRGPHPSTSFGAVTP